MDKNLKAGVQRRTLRCAIYTRKSTEHGVGLEFNSLEAQRESCAANVASQRHDGWTLSAKRYDDAAYSGGNLERPALKSLLADIAAGLVDIVVVYKIDRLTRSLADFARLVERFEARQVSFVAVTQQFNTTSSMGRLTLNVLLSFAQFERELASERVRDKLTASRKKGLWTGGSVPLGYDVKDKKLVVNAREAATVRLMFRRYLALGALLPLLNELKQRGLKTKRRGRQGGSPFTFGPLAYLLKNRTYRGEIGLGGNWYAGQHSAIVPADLFQAVQKQLADNATVRVNKSAAAAPVLTGLLYDQRGNLFSPSFTTKKGVRYRFYVNSALLKGRRDDAVTVRRLNATDIEGAVLAAMRARFASSHTLPDRNLIVTHLQRAQVTQRTLTLTCKGRNGKTTRLTIKRLVPAPRARCETNLGAAPDPIVVTALARAHAWLEALKTGRYRSIEALATAAKRHPKVVRKALRLAFLAPDITTGVLNGSVSAPLNRLQGIKTSSWAEQRTALARTVRTTR